MTMPPLAAAQLDSNAQGHLIACHNPEMFSSGLNAEDLWGASYEEMAATNHATSRAVLQELMIKVAPPRLSEEEQLQAVERFLNERCHFITVAAANCVSLTLADPQDVYQRYVCCCCLCCCCQSDAAAACAMPLRPPLVCCIAA
jgi:hypothetical protein